MTGFFQYLQFLSLLSFRLISEKGLPALRTLFDDVKFKGKGHEVIANLSYWIQLFVEYWNAPEFFDRRLQMLLFQFFFVFIN